MSNITATSFECFETLLLTDPVLCEMTTEDIDKLYWLLMLFQSMWLIEMPLEIEDDENEHEE